VVKKEFMRRIKRKKVGSKQGEAGPTLSGKTAEHSAGFHSDGRRRQLREVWIPMSYNAVGGFNAGAARSVVANDWSCTLIELPWVGAGMIDKARAIAEVRRRRRSASS